MPMPLEGFLRETGVTGCVPNKVYDHQPGKVSLDIIHKNLKMLDYDPQT